MLALLVFTFLTMILGIVTFCKILKRQNRKNCRVIFFFTFAFLTLVLIMLYCMTAFESGILDTGCFTSGIEISPSWAYALTSIMYLWN